MKKQISALFLVILLAAAGCSTMKQTEEIEQWIPQEIASYDMEQAVCRGGVKVLDGVAGGFREEGDGLSIPVTAPRDDFYDLSFQIRTQGGYKENYVCVDGQRLGVICADSADFREISYPRVYLEKGTHQVGLSSYWGWCELDRIRLLTSQPFDESIFEVSARLSDPEADEITRRVFSYLCDTYGKKILTGQYIDNGRPEGWEIIKVVENNGNHFPAVLGLDMVRLSQTGIDHECTTDVTAQAINYWKQGGLVTFCWHWMLDDRFVTGNWYSSFYSDQVDICLKDILDGKDEEGRRLLRQDIDNVAKELLKLQEAGVPVLWRPLHEASGGWFWWGKEGPEVYKRLYIRLYEILTQEYGLHNLIWVWNGQAADWYPGDAYVDMVGMDAYAGPREYSSQMAQFLLNQSYAPTDKIVVLSENGTVFDPELAVRDRAMWGFFCTWGSKHVMTDGSIKQYSEEFTEKDMLKKAYESQYAVNREDLPDFAAYPLREEAK